MSYKYRIKATVDAIKFTGKAGQKPIIEKFIDSLANLKVYDGGIGKLSINSIDKCDYPIKVGDYIVKKNNFCWVVDSNVFNESYELIKE